MTSPSSGHILPDSTDQGIWHLFFLVPFLHPVPGLQICSSLGLAGLIAHSPPTSLCRHFLRHEAPELSPVLVWTTDANDHRRCDLSVILTVLRAESPRSRSQEMRCENFLEQQF